MRPRPLVLLLFLFPALTPAAARASVWRKSAAQPTEHRRLRDWFSHRKTTRPTVATPAPPPVAPPLVVAPVSPELANTTARVADQALAPYRARAAHAQRLGALFGQLGADTNLAAMMKQLAEHRGDAHHIPLAYDWPTRTVLWFRNYPETPGFKGEIVVDFIYADNQYSFSNAKSIHNLSRAHFRVGQTYTEKSEPVGALSPEFLEQIANVFPYVDDRVVADAIEFWRAHPDLTRDQVQEYWNTHPNMKVWEHAFEGLPPRPGLPRL
jgi:hypothetical protein